VLDFKGIIVCWHDNCRANCAGNLFPIALSLLTTERVCDRGLGSIVLAIILNVCRGYGGMIPHIM
jgi:hypothetical protein